MQKIALSNDDGTRANQSHPRPSTKAEQFLSACTIFERRLSEGDYREYVGVDQPLLRFFKR